jgi:hypothetical protein
MISVIRLNVVAPSFLFIFWRKIGRNKLGRNKLGRYKAALNILKILLSESQVELHLGRLQGPM